MIQALKEANDIKRMREAISKTKSNYLINDYKKAISRKIRDLKEYCDHKEIDFKELEV